MLHPTMPPSMVPSPFCRRVLLVDDDENVRRGLSRVLKRGGFDVDTAEDGGEALRILQTCAFDVVVSDVNMPVLDGEGLIELMQDLELDVPLILITGDPDSVDPLILALQMQVQLLAKPVAPDQLNNAVRAVLTPESTAELI